MLLLIFVAVGVSASVSFAAATTDPAVTLVSPPEDEAIVADNFLVSIKVTQPGKTLKISVGALQIKDGDKFVAVTPGGLEDYSKKSEEDKQTAPLMETQTFVSKGSVSFFTHKVENVTPGVYVIKVSTVDADGGILFSREARVLVKEKAADADAKVVFDSQKSGASQFLQNLLSKIFKN
jgi:hypothetical protein